MAPFGDEEFWRETLSILRNAPSLEKLRAQMSRLYEKATRLGPGHGVEAANVLKFLALPEKLVT